MLERGTYMTKLSLPAAVAVLAFAASASAQTYYDFLEQRNVPHPFASLFQIEAGAIGTDAKDHDPDDTGDNAEVRGRDGIFASLHDSKLIGDETVTRFELRARPWMFYRDGFYDDGELRKNGFYEGSDYEGYVGFGRAQDGLYVELGPYYRRHDFSRSNLTPVTFTIPDDFAAYGARLYLEQAMINYDRRRGAPRDGYALSLVGEREWNDSKDPFGTDQYSTELPRAVWRLRGRLDWYIPASDSICWEVFASGGWHDEKDRLQNTEGQRPLGSQWGDVQLRLRFHLGQSLTITPFAHGQYSRVVDETGFDSTKDFFFGGGVESYWHLGDSISLHGWYSYLDNENRPSIRIDRDVHGEHMFYLGMVVRFASTRR